MAYNIRGKTLSTIIPQSLYNKYPNFITFLDKYYDFSRKSVIELNSSVGNVNLSSKFYGITSEFYVNREVTNTMDKSYTVDFDEKRTFLPTEDIIALRPLTSPLSLTIGVDREYVLDKISEPKLTFYYDQRYVIENNTGATVYIKDQQTTGSANQYSPGVTTVGTTITIDPDSSTPRLYYTVAGYSGIGLINVEVIPIAHTYTVENIINTGIRGTAGYTNSVYGFGNIYNVLFNPDYLIDNFNTITTINAPDALFFKYLDSQGLGDLFSQTIANRSSVDDFTRFLQSKGTTNAIKFFFRSFFDQDVEVNYPGENVMKSSDGDYFLQQKMFITAVEPLELTRNRRIKGLTSGAYATVESHRFSPENYYHIISVDKDKIVGTFIINEDILVIDNTNSDIEYDIGGTLYGTISGIEVLQPGIEYDRGEILTNTYTLENVARETIISVDDITSSSIEHVDINTILTHASHSGAAFTVGETITQATTGATGVVRASTVDVTTVQNLNTGTWGTSNNVTGGTSSVTLSSSHLTAVASGGINYAVGDELLFPKPAEQLTFSATIDSSQSFSFIDNEYTFSSGAVSINITLEDDVKNTVLFTTDSNTYNSALVEINGINYTSLDIVENEPSSSDVLTLPINTVITIRSGQSIKVTIGANKIVDRFHDASFFDTSATVTTVAASGYVSRVNESTGAIEELKLSNSGAGYKKRPTTDILLPDASTKAIAAIPTDSNSLTYPSILENNNILTHAKFASLRIAQTITLEHTHMDIPFVIGTTITQANTDATGIVSSVVSKFIDDAAGMNAYQRTGVPYENLATGGTAFGGQPMTHPSRARGVLTDSSGRPVPTEIFSSSYYPSDRLITGAIVFNEGETITQANSGASGIKLDYQTANSSTGTIFDLKTGTWNTSDTVTGGTTGITISAPSSVGTLYFPGLGGMEESAGGVSLGTPVTYFTNVIVGRGTFNTSNNITGSVPVGSGTTTLASGNLTGVIGQTTHFIPDEEVRGVTSGATGRALNKTLEVVHGAQAGFIVADTLTGGTSTATATIVSKPSTTRSIIVQPTNSPMFTVGETLTNNVTNLTHGGVSSGAFTAGNIISKGNVRGIITEVVDSTHVKVRISTDDKSVSGTTAGASAFVIGDEISQASTNATGIITDTSGTAATTGDGAGAISYITTSGTFSGNNAITATRVSGTTANSTSFVIGEIITQATTNAIGVITGISGTAATTANGTGEISYRTTSGTFSGNNVITGATSGTTITGTLTYIITSIGASATLTYSDIPFTTGVITEYETSKTATVATVGAFSTASTTSFASGTGSEMFVGSNLNLIDVSGTFVSGETIVGTISGAEVSLCFDAGFASKPANFSITSGNSLNLYNAISVAVTFNNLNTGTTFAVGAGVEGVNSGVTGIVAADPAPTSSSFTVLDLSLSSSSSPYYNRRGVFIQGEVIRESSYGGLVVILRHIESGINSSQGFTVGSTITQATTGASGVVKVSTIDFDTSSSAYDAITIIPTHDDQTVLVDAGTGVWGTANDVTQSSPSSITLAASALTAIEFQDHCAIVTSDNDLNLSDDLVATVIEDGTNSVTCVPALGASKVFEVGKVILGRAGISTTLGNATPNSILSNVITEFDGNDGKAIIPYETSAKNALLDTIIGVTSGAVGNFLDLNNANSTNSEINVDLSSGTYIAGETIVNSTGRLATTISSIKSLFDVGETVKQETVTLTHGAQTFAVGRTLTGSTSGATGRIKTTSSTSTVLTNVIGTFVIETVTESVDGDTAVIGADGVATTTIATGLIISSNDTRTVVTNQTGTFNTSDILSGASSKMVAIPSAVNQGANADLSVFGEDFGGIIQASITNDVVGVTRNEEVTLTRSDVVDITGENAEVRLLSGYYKDYGKEFTSVSGHLSDTSIKITDSYRYQDFSYVIKTSLSSSDFLILFKKLAHPAGMALFNDFLLINSFQQKLNKGVSTATKEITINIHKTSVTKLIHAAQTFTKGRKITGGTSGATGRVAIAHNNRLSITLDKVRGTFVVGETLTEEISNNTAVVASSGVIDIDKLHLIFSASSISAIQDFFVRYFAVRGYDDKFEWLGESLISFSNVIQMYGVTYSILTHASHSGSAFTVGEYVSQPLIYLRHDNPNPVFVAGRTLTGGTSGATGTVATTPIPIAGSTAVTPVSGTFVIHEIVTESSGSNTAILSSVTTKADGIVISSTVDETKIKNLNNGPWVIDQIVTGATSGVTLSSSHLTKISVDTTDETNYWYTNSDTIAMYLDVPINQRTTTKRSSNDVTSTGTDSPFRNFRQTENVKTVNGAGTVAFSDTTTVASNGPPGPVITITGSSSNFINQCSPRDILTTDTILTHAAGAYTDGEIVNQTATSSTGTVRGSLSGSTSTTVIVTAGAFNTSTAVVGDTSSVSHTPSAVLGSHAFLVVVVASDTSLTAQRTSVAGATGSISGRSYTVAQKRINELNNATFDDLIQHGYAMTIQDVNNQFLSGSELTMDQFQDVFVV